jgi:hypothetical protein
VEYNFAVIDRVCNDDLANRIYRDAKIDQVYKVAKADCGCNDTLADHFSAILRLMGFTTSLYLKNMKYRNPTENFLSFGKLMLG